MFFILGVLFASAPTAWAQSASTLPAGPRKSIAVMGFDGAVPFEGGDAAQGLTTMLTAALIKDGRFVVVERAAIADVAIEQRLTQGANAAAKSLTPANVLVRGTVTKFAPKVSGGSVNVGMFGSGFLGGALGVSGDHSDVELTLRLMDPATGRLLSSATAKGTAASTGINANIVNKQGMNFGGDAFKNSPLGEACEAAILQAIEQIAAAMDNVVWSAQVLNSDTGKVYIDAGTIQNVQVGAIFKVYHNGMILTDPSTGAVIDVIESPVGSISVTAVREKTSIGVVTDGALPQRGDIVRVN
jgi:curli biogenesis system outer membrane secretion channel CsgG